MYELRVKPTQRAAPRATVIVLYEFPVESSLCEFIRVPRLEEEAAIVSMNIGLDQ